MAASHYESVKGVLSVPRSLELFSVFGKDAERVSIGSQKAAFIADTSAVFFPIFEVVSKVKNPFSVVFDPKFNAWRNTLFQIFGKIPTRAMADSFASTDKVVDGNLARTWASQFLDMALAADGHLASQERETADPFGAGRTLGFDSFKGLMITAAVIVGGLAIISMGD